MYVMKLRFQCVREDLQTATSRVSGMNYALLQARTSGKPSIVSMSLGGAANVAIDAAANAVRDDHIQIHLNVLGH